MENNLPQKYNDGFFSKIRKFLHGIFYRKGKESKQIRENTQDNKDINNTDSNNTIDILKKENQKYWQKRDILLQVEKNPDVINDWPIDSLLKLEKVIDEEIAMCEKDISVLKANKGLS
ncbi:MAG: hypothetical protein IKE01_01145 [Clostridia bacterium]|nr:hypothetical protein [Clostridia bacterium]